jgi:hypothetical protein
LAVLRGRYRDGYNGGFLQKDRCSARIRNIAVKVSINLPKTLTRMAPATKASRFLGFHGLFYVFKQDFQE